MPVKLDAIDRKILKALQRDGRLQNIELAEKVGLSPSPCLRRVRLLEENGYIEQYAALLSARTLGLPMHIFLRVTLKSQDKESVESFTKKIVKYSEVVECYLMAGEYDFFLRVVAEDLEDYQRFQMDVLTPMPEVQNVVTKIPLKEIKNTHALPLDRNFA